MKNFILFAVFFVIGCSSGSQSKDSLPCIDIRKNYTEKEIVLTDVADITYVHLNSENDDNLYKGTINYVSKNTIVVCDESSGSILFFSKDGTPKSRFNRYGAGPEEYFWKGRAVRIIYDENNDDVFVFSLNDIHVYSSTGEYKRKITLQQGRNVQTVVDFDDLSLFVYNIGKEWIIYSNESTEEEKIISKTDYDSSYLFISKTDGKILDYLIFPSNDINLNERSRNGDRGPFRRNHRVVANTEGLFLIHCDIDTVFLYGKDKSLTPVFCKTPLVSDLDPKVVIYKYMETDKYQFIVLFTLINNPFGSFYKYYMRNKQTGEIFLQNIILPDYKDKEFFILNYNDMFNYFEMDLLELKQAYRENRLSGKLKELVATLNEYEDNNVWMFVHYK